MNSLTHIAPRTGAVALPAPQYGQTVPIKIPTQKRGYDSDKRIYSYQKKQEAIYQHHLVWATMPLTIKDQLLDFSLAALGSKHEIIWNDHIGLDRTVRIIGAIEWKQNSPETCRCSITLEHRFCGVWGVYTGSDEQILTGADGKIITW